MSFSLIWPLASALLISISSFFSDLLTNHHHQTLLHSSREQTCCLPRLPLAPLPEPLSRLLSFLSSHGLFLSFLCLEPKRRDELGSCTSSQHPWGRSTLVQTRRPQLREIQQVGPLWCTWGGHAQGCHWTTWDTGWRMRTKIQVMLGISFWSTFKKFNWNVNDNI